MNNIPIHSLKLPNSLEVQYIGPQIDIGPLPSVFYFALSAEESLSVNPYSQPVEYLSSYPIRIFSMTLPFHGKGYSNVEALKIWAEKIKEGQNILEDFIQNAVKTIDTMVEEKIITPYNIGIAGLSRGALVALNIAALCPRIPNILLFAPLLDLAYVEEFINLKNNTQVKNTSSLNLAHYLLNRNIRIYIGNRDIRVGTDISFNFIRKISELSFNKKISPCNAEMIIKPSIGAYGHGTSSESFNDGAKWLSSKLQLSYSAYEV